MNEIWLANTVQRLAAVRACTSHTPSAGEDRRNVDRSRRIPKAGDCAINIEMQQEDI